MSASTFAEDYSKACDKVSRALRDYLGDPKEDNTRIVRACIRRQDTMIALVPKRYRSRTMKLAQERCRKVLKVTSRIRDLDILRGKLSKVPGDEAVLLLLSNMEEERGEYVSDSMKPAWKLFELHDKSASAKDFRGVARWVRRALEDLDGEMEAEIALVVKNEGKVDELHSLRKHAKRFRYALELIQGNRGTPRALGLLRLWQDILGEIRDSDILIEYLGRARQVRAIREALLKERASRRRRYRAFVRSYAEEFKGGSSPLRLAGLRK